jgi:hypothetical protein
LTMPPAFEVLLLNTAVPQIQAAQSGDTYVVPRDIAFSAALTLSAGTANGVPYLNGSKVLTTGSALTYNGTGLGVGISSAGYLVDISTPLTGTTVGSNVALNLESQASGRDVEIRMGDTVNSSGRFGYLSGSLYWAFGSTEQMRLTSTGLGIGTSSPDSKLVVQGGSGTYAQIKDGTVNIFIQARSVDSAGVIGTLTNHALQFWTNSAVKATIDSSGNLGLGVTPSAWNSATKAMQISTAATFWGLNNNQAYVGSNSFYDSLGNFKYIVTDNATQYRQWQGAHAWFNAPSGTAGNAITFTQAMTLDASGNLGIGTSSPDSGFQLTAYADVAGAIRVRGGGTGSNTARTASLSLLSSGNEEWIVRGANDSLRFLQSSTERARITSGGNFKIGGSADRATTEGTNQLVLFNGTAPVGTLTNGVSFYSASGEARVMDAAGNSTLLSPHDQTTNEWIFHSKHTPTGKVLKIDVERLLKFVNDHFGLDAVHEFIED